jgi:hypothetical protein
MDSRYFLIIGITTSAVKQHENDIIRTQWKIMTSRAPDGSATDALMTSFAAFAQGSNAAM